MNVNETHDLRARSFVASANEPGCDFPLQNLPLGAYTRGDNNCPRLAVAIGDQLLDLPAAVECKLLDVDGITLEELCEKQLNRLMGLGPAHWGRLRLALFRLLREDSPQRGQAARCLRPLREVQMVLPAQIGNYTDFYASVHHAANVGALFRPDNPLLPNYRWVPIGYHGRASTLVASGTAVRRPWGQLKPPTAAEPIFAPARRLDYELELGAMVGVGNEMGEPVPIAQAAGHIFGLCLLNDWSARDIQAWEYQPLGPFLAKSFATSISPWIVTTEALAPFRTPAVARGEGEPQPLPYLRDSGDQQHGGFDITVEAWLRTAAMRERGTPPCRLSHGNFREMYWTFAQMLAHHTSNGCDLRPGDLLGSGTISGPQPEARGCLLELTRGGAEPVLLSDGSRRSFLEDGDELTLRAYCERAGAVRIGFGECTGVVQAAR